MNKSREIRIEKVTLNIGTGQPGEKLEKAMKLLQIISSRKPVQRVSKKRIPTWGVRPGLAIGAKVTIRGQEAEKLLSRLLKSKENKLFSSNFDESGNFSFGIPEYIDIEGMDYLVEIGIMGLEVAVTLERNGYRIKKRKYLQKRIPFKHIITPLEAMEFISKKFNVKILEEDE